MKMEKLLNSLLKPNVKAQLHFQQDLTHHVWVHWSCCWNVARIHQTFSYCSALWVTQKTPEKLECWLHIELVTELLLDSFWNESLQLLLETSPVGTRNIFSMDDIHHLYYNIYIYLSSCEAYVDIADFPQVNVDR